MLFFEKGNLNLFFFLQRNLNTALGQSKLTDQRNYSLIAMLKGVQREERTFRGMTVVVNLFRVLVLWSLLGETGGYYIGLIVFIDVHDYDYIVSCVYKCPLMATDYSRALNCTS